MATHIYLSNNTREQKNSNKETLGPDLQKRRQILTTLSVEEQVLNMLHFYATGSFQHCVGNNIFNGLSQFSVSRSIECVTNAIISHLSHHVSFPLDRQSQLDIKKTFWNICRLPNIVGAIDCTHITIRKPVKESHVYINRKAHYSINVQLVCNTDLMILNVCVKWPGSTHDSFIWRNSSLHELFSTGHIPSSYLLGDSGYPLEPWLMTPLIETHTQAEEEYNQRHIRGRVCIERCNGVLKSRWRCLHSSGGSLQYAPGKVCRIIVACAILHNLCIKESIPSIIDDDLIFGLKYEKYADSDWIEWETEKILGNEDSKSAMLILNQPIDKMESFILAKWNKVCFHIAVDGGLLHLHKLAISKHADLQPELITGDFDSITQDILNFYEKKGSRIIQTPNQDATDFTKALNEMTKIMKNIKIESVLAIASISGRLDHIMGNLQTLYLAKEMNCPPVYLISDKCLTWLLYKGKHQIKVNRSFLGFSVGLIPLNICHVTTTGLKWNLNNTELKFGGHISTSNTYEDHSDYVTIETDNDLIWTMEIIL